MGYWKNARIEMEREQEQEKGLYPVGYVIENLKDYQRDLVEKEVDSLRELNKITYSFKKVLSTAQCSQFPGTESVGEEAAHKAADKSADGADSLQKAQLGVGQVVDLLELHIEGLAEHGNQERRIAECGKKGEPIFFEHTRGQKAVVFLFHS